MKDKRTAEEKAANESFIREIALNGVVGCSHRVIIVPPGKDWSRRDPERCWTLMIEQWGGNGFRGDVVIAWYKTRDAARQHAKLLRQALNQLVVVK